MGGFYGIGLIIIIGLFLFSRWVNVLKITGGGKVNPNVSSRSWIRR